MNPVNRDEIAKIFRKWLKEEISGEEVSAISSCLDELLDNKHLKTAYWIKHKNKRKSYIQCSNCEGKIDFGRYWFENNPSLLDLAFDIEPGKYKYCYRCGCKMLDKNL